MRPFLGTLGFFGLFGFLVTACVQPPLPTIPEGMHSFTGVLLPTSLSLTRRGTHIIQVDDLPLYFVESQNVSLHSYEGRFVAVRGVIERNVDPEELPVLVAEDIRQVLDPSLREWTAPVLGLSLQIPRDWSAVNDHRGLKLFLPETGALVVEAFGEQSADLPYDMRTAALRTPSPDADVAPILIGSTRAVRMLEHGTGVQRISFLHENTATPPAPRSPGEGGNPIPPTESGAIVHDVLTFVYTPLPDTPEELDAVFLSIIHSIAFSGQRAASSASNSVVPPPDAGNACGGPAGILCPAGAYCEVTDLATNIGRCRKL